jgi:hypothetical protein
MTKLLLLHVLLIQLLLLKIELFFSSSLPFLSFCHFEVSYTNNFLLPSRHQLTSNDLVLCLGLKQLRLNVSLCHQQAHLLLLQLFFHF